MSRELDAGRELDELIAVRVMGLSLVPPRGFALAVVGAHETSVTGKDWRLTSGKVVYVPDGATLEQPEGTTDYNARYFAYVAEHGVDDLEAKVAACRIPPKPYSTSIAAAWEVVEKLDEAGWLPQVMCCRPFGWRCELLETEEEGDGDLYADADTAPLAICRAALQAASHSPNSAVQSDTPREDV